jgi:hypothetical protein
MKGQVNAISIILVTGILVSLVGTAYFWGIPLIEKRSTITQFTTAEGFMKKLDNRIVEIANSNSGQETLDIPFGGITVVPYQPGEDSNYIIFEFVVNQPLVLNSSIIYLEEATFEDVTSDVGVFGVSSPGLISMQSEPIGGQYKMIIKLQYRELDSDKPKKGYKIVLNGIKKRGNSKISLSYDRREVLEGQASNGGDLILTYINVEVV